MVDALRAIKEWSTTVIIIVDLKLNFIPYLYFVFSNNNINKLITKPNLLFSNRFQINSTPKALCCSNWLVQLVYLVYAHMSCDLAKLTRFPVAHKFINKTLATEISPIWPLLFATRTHCVGLPHWLIYKTVTLDHRHNKLPTCPFILSAKDDRLKQTIAVYKLTCPSWDSVHQL